MDGDVFSSPDARASLPAGAGTLRPATSRLPSSLDLLDSVEPPAAGPPRDEQPLDICKREFDAVLAALDS